MKAFILLHDLLVLDASTIIPYWFPVSIECFQPDDNILCFRRFGLFSRGSALDLYLDSNRRLLATRT